MPELINKDALIVIFKPIIKALFDKEKEEAEAQQSTLMSSGKSTAEVRAGNGSEFLSLTSSRKLISKMMVL